RSLEHRTLANVCREASKQSPPDKYKPCLPAGGLSDELINLAALVPVLQQKRHQADYDPMFAPDRADVEVALREARTALDGFQASNAEQREAFLGILFFQPR